MGKRARALEPSAQSSVDREAGAADLGPAFEVKQVQRGQFRQALQGFWVQPDVDFDLLDEVFDEFLLGFFQLAKVGQLLISDVSGEAF